MEAQINSNLFLIQYKLTVPKVGYISDLCTSLSNLSDVPAEKVRPYVILYWYSRKGVRICVKMHKEK